MYHVFRNFYIAASIPTNVVGRNETNLRIRLDWGEPVSRNGIITGYRVSLKMEIKGSSNIKCLNLVGV